jgi:hypothetical protein
MCLAGNPTTALGEAENHRQSQSVRWEVAAILGMGRGMGAVPAAEGFGGKHDWKAFKFCLSDYDLE